MNEAVSRQRKTNSKLQEQLLCQPRHLTPSSSYHSGPTAHQNTKNKLIAGLFLQTNKLGLASPG